MTEHQTKQITPEMYAKQLKYSEKLREVIDEYDSLLNELLEEILPSVRLSAEITARLDEGIAIPVSPDEEDAIDEAAKGEKI
jgi:hypothetical protein